MRRLWKGLLLGSLVGGLVYLIYRRQAGGKRRLPSWYRRAARTVGRQLRDAQGAWRVSRRMVRGRHVLGGISRFARRLLIS